MVLFYIFEFIYERAVLSLKNDIEMVKEELNSEEKFFEKAVVTERFIKKYKNLMIGVGVALVVGTLGNFAYNMNKASNIASANEQLVILQKDSTNKSALAQLKIHSPALYELYTYSQAIVNNDTKTLATLKNSKLPLLGDLATYEDAQRTNDKAALSDYASQQGRIYKDLAQLQLAIMLMDSQKIEQAHEELATIEESSPLYKIARALRHYGVK